MIKRDQYGIIVQHDPNNPSYADGGDSCNRNGIMAFSGSVEDQKMSFLFVKAGDVVIRHPYQAAWNNASETSRDAIVAYFAGTGASVVQRASASIYASSWFINKDFLDPAVRLYLYTCAKTAPPLYIAILGRMWLFLALLYNCYIQPKHEQNQFACICAVMGSFWLKKLVNWHPDLYGGIREYWGGWRDQPEIGFAFVSELMRRYNE